MNSLFLMIVTLTSGELNAEVDFDNEIVPVFTKSGCNTGACHGAAIGRGGFKLSLYGGNPEADYQVIVRELEGRRVNIARPDESLVFLKPTESISHGGGERLAADSNGANLLLNWIRQGTPRMQNKTLQQVEITPKSLVTGLGQVVPFKAVARFSDGTDVDVTEWTVFKSEDATAVRIDAESGAGEMLRRGRHIVVARYLSQVQAVELMVPLADSPRDLSRQIRHNFIDEQILELLQTLRLPVSPVIDDATFLRRISLDLTGRLPSHEAYREFLATEKDARTQLINKLLQSEEFTEYWTFKLAQLLRIRSHPKDAQGASAYHAWLKTQIARATPYNALAYQILTAVGDTHEVGPANFYRTVGGAREQAEFTSELFMANRLRCANCHNHPLDRWTQDDYHGLAAIFAKIEQGKVVKVSARGEVTHPRTGEAAIPKIPGQEFLDVPDGRTALATWLTSPDNPYFAKAIVNRLWKAMMGRGLIEPTDDFRATNPATHPELLEQLADDFVKHGFDLRHTLRRIAQSAAYARSVQTLPENEADQQFYSHAFMRSLPAEVHLDAINDVTGVGDRFGAMPQGTRAVMLFDSKVESDALDILGRCSREESCEVQAETTDGLTRKLHLLNGSLLNKRIADPAGRLAKLINEGVEPAEIIQEFYLRALSRLPKPSESEYWNRHLSATQDPKEIRQVLEDFVWSLLTCNEFITNH